MPAWGREQGTERAVAHARDVGHVTCRRQRWRSPACAAAAAPPARLNVICAETSCPRVIWGGFAVMLMGSVAPGLRSTVHILLMLSRPALPLSVAWTCPGARRPSGSTVLCRCRVTRVSAGCPGRPTRRVERPSRRWGHHCGRARGPGGHGCRAIRNDLTDREEFDHGFAEGIPRVCGAGQRHWRVPSSVVASARWMMARGTGWCGGYPWFFGGRSSSAMKRSIREGGRTVGGRPSICCQGM